MTATWNSDQFPLGFNASGNPVTTKPIGAHGDFKSFNHLHAVTALASTAGLNDTINVGYLPPNAVVTGTTSKAQTQLDSATSLTLDLGIVGTTQLFQSALNDVGRAAGASFDATINAAGKLWKNTTGAKVLVIGTIHAAAGTPVAGNLEHLIDYFIEE